ncbi:MAG: hypothetical protein EOM18_13440 [Clostridia bacterium]|nr:hypothetical protein [Clostridia bacterium]
MKKNTKEIKKWMPFFVALCVCMLILILPVNTDGADADPVAISLHYGFQDNLKTGSCLPLQVTLENQGEEFQGRLEINVPAPSDEQDVASSVFLNENEWGTSKDRIYTYQKDITLAKGQILEELIYLELPVFEGQLEVEVKENDQLLGSRSMQFDFMENSSRVLLGIVTDKQEEDTLDGMAVSLESGYSGEVFVKTIYLRPEEIYAYPDALEQLDVLIADTDTGFTQEQQEALAIWKNNGGFYLQREEGETLDSVFQTLLVNDGESTGNTFLAHLEEMQSFSYGSSYNLNSVPVTKRPSLGIYLVLLLIYLIMSGPGIYLFLRKKKKQKHLWSVICASSIIFMGIIWILGKKTNVYAPFISYSGLYEQQENVWSETAQVGIQAPYNDQYHLYINSEYRMLPLGLGSGGIKDLSEATSEQVLIKLGEKNNKVTAYNASAFTMNAFEISKSNLVGEDERIQVDFSGDGERLEGTWKNPTKYNIKSAVVIMRGRVVSIGDMDAGTTGKLSDAQIYAYGNSGMELFLEDQVDFSSYEYPEYEMSNLSGRIWDVVLDQNQHREYLFGIVENPDFSFQGDSGYKIHGSAVVKIPINNRLSES